MLKDNTPPMPEATEQLPDIELLDRTQLSKLGAKQHYDLSQVLATTRDVMVGLNCQPRFNMESGPYNEAGEVLDRIISGFDAAIEAVRESARSTPATDQWALLYKWMVPIAREVDYADDLHKIAKLSIEAANEVSAAKLREARRLA